MMSEIKTCYNLVVLETSEVKFGEVKTNKQKNQKGNIGINNGWSANICTCVTLFNSLNFSRPQIPHLQNEKVELNDLFQVLSNSMIPLNGWGNKGVKICAPKATLN